MLWIDTILLFSVNTLLLIGTVFTFVLAVILFMKSADRATPFISLLISIAFISTFIIINYL